LLETWINGITHSGDPSFFTPEKIKETMQKAKTYMAHSGKNKYDEYVLPAKKAHFEEE